MRKGYWDASPQQVWRRSPNCTPGWWRQFEAGCSGFVCDNAALASFIAEQAPPELAASYLQRAGARLTSSVELTEASVVLAEQEAQPRPANTPESGSARARFAWLGAVIVAGLFVVVLLLLRKRRNAT